MAEDYLDKLQQDVDTMEPILTDIFGDHEIHFPYIYVMELDSEMLLRLMEKIKPIGYTIGEITPSTKPEHYRIELTIWENKVQGNVIRSTMLCLHLKAC